MTSAYYNGDACPDPYRMVYRFGHPIAYLLLTRYLFDKATHAPVRSCNVPGWGGVSVRPNFVLVKHRATL